MLHIFTVIAHWGILRFWRIQSRRMGFDSPSFYTVTGTRLSAAFVDFMLVSRLEWKR